MRHQQGGGVVFGVQNEDEVRVLQLGIFCMRQGMREGGSHVDGEVGASRTWGDFARLRSASAGGLKHAYGHLERVSVDSSHPARL